MIDPPPRLVSIKGREFSSSNFHKTGLYGYHNEYSQVARFPQTTPSSLTAIIDFSGFAKLELLRSHMI